MNHTPGPWRLSESNTIWGRNEEYIAEVSDMDDATLIAVAPLMKGQLETGIEAMREALRQAAACDYDQVHAILSGIIAGNELVITKAEGKG